MAEGDFLKQLAAAAVIMGSLVTGLSYVGRSSRRPETTPPPSAVSVRSPLSLVPGSAWLVVEFESSLVNALPFAGDGPPCDAEPAPTRVVFAVVGGNAPNSEPSFWFGAPRVSPTFFSCARSKILASGGKETAAGGLIRLDSPSGVLIHDGDLLLFSTSRSDLTALQRLLRSPALSAAESGPHTVALADLQKVSPTPLALSLQLPTDWTMQMDPEFAHSPLRALRGATLSLTRSGGAAGVIRCDPPGCRQLRAFAERALTDLLAQIPPSLQPRFAEAIQLGGPTADQPAQLELRVGRSGVELAQYLLSSWDETQPLPLDP